MTIGALAKRIRRQEFHESRGSGFILDRVRHDSLDGRFVERYEYVETVSDPYGIELTFDRIEFRKVAFRATPGWPGLELIDAPRSIQSLVSGLLEASDFELAVSPIEVDVLAWADEFQRLLGAQALIDSLQVAALVVAEGVRAKILLRGEKDVRAACDELVQGRKHILEKLQLRVTFEHARTTVLLTNGASAKVDAVPAHPELVDLLRASLPKPADGKM